MIKKVLTIAGSDCSGGAGIQADIKTITAHKMYAMSAITALTAQNTTGVYGIFEVTPEFVSAQIDRIFEDIRPDAVKLGMVTNSGIIDAIADALQRHGAGNIVVDPVMVATSGGRLLVDGAVTVLADRLFPIAKCITPNIQEAEALTGLTISSEDDMINAAEKLSQHTAAAVLIKGGHSKTDATDILYTDGAVLKFSQPKINTENTHGTGCTLSSAIACNLARGLTVGESVRLAKEYITGALSSGLDLGRGNGPVNHVFCL